MLYEYAIEPDLLTSWASARMVLNLMGFQHARAERLGPRAARDRERLVARGAGPQRVAAIGRDHLPFIQQMYSNSTVEIENEGHTFGSSLSPADKKALTAFLATL